MMELEQLCRRIDMPEEVTQKVLSIRENYDMTKHQKQIAQLTKHSEWEEGLSELKKNLSDDKDGFIMLTCMLTAGLSTYESYIKKGISEDIFFDTFGCFSRFVKEYKVSYNTYGFDRDFWAPRQLAMDLFRIGELEYELFTEKGRDFISLHIPSDSMLTKENCRKSYEMAIEFLAKYYPDYHYELFVCESWLLCPNLKDILTEDSRIIQFQNSFNIESHNTQATDYKEWVFKNRDISIDEAPQNTSLQRKLKEYVINGGVIGNGAGYLKPDAFL